MARWCRRLRMRRDGQASSPPSARGKRHQPRWPRDSGGTVRSVPRTATAMVEAGWRCTGPGANLAATCCAFQTERAHTEGYGNWPQERSPDRHRNRRLICEFGGREKTALFSEVSISLSAKGGRAETRHEGCEGPDRRGVQSSRPPIAIDPSSARRRLISTWSAPAVPRRGRPHHQSGSQTGQCSRAPDRRRRCSARRPEIGVPRGSVTALHRQRDRLPNRRRLIGDAA
jgi:hypothetical protein